MTYDVPAHITAHLDQHHAAANARLDGILAGMIQDGLHDLDAPVRAIGIATGYTALPRDVLVEIAAMAVSRLIELETRTHAE